MPCLIKSRWVLFFVFLCAIWHAFSVTTFLQGPCFPLLHVSFPHWFCQLLFVHCSFSSCYLRQTIVDFRRGDSWSWPWPWSWTQVLTTHSRSQDTDPVLISSTSMMGWHMPQSFLNKQFASHHPVLWGKTCWIRLKVISCCLASVTQNCPRHIQLTGTSIAIASESPALHISGLLVVFSL